MNRKAVPEVLREECHVLGRLPRAVLLLQRNAILPWFVLYPASPVNDVLDLPPAELHPLLDDCAAVARFIRQYLGYPKTNFAGLGNVLPDLHLHVIGRRPGDACWPQPVWGNLPQGGQYTATELQRWQDELVRCAGLTPEPL